MPEDPTYCRDSLFVGIKEERDRLREENEKLQKDLSEAEVTIEDLRKDRAEVVAGKEESGKKVKKLELATSRLQGQLRDMQTELNGVKKESDDAEEKVRVVSSQAVEFTLGAYQKAPDHVRCMYPEAVLGPDFFQFEHEIRDGRIVKYHPN